MKLKTKLSLAACSVLTGSILLTGCGGGSDSVVLTTTPTTTGSVSTVSGAVTASTFENAKVFLDLNNNGTLDLDEPTALTNENGEFEINYILEDGVEYILIAQGQTGTIRHDDNGTDEDASNLLMFTSITGGGESNVNPNTLKGFLSDLNTTLGGIDGNVSGFISDTDTNKTSLYNKYVKGKDLTTALESANSYIKLKNGNARLTTVKTDLGVEDTTTLVFDNSDKNTTELSQLGAYKDKTLPAKIGKLVVSTPLQNVDIEVTSTVDDTNITGVTAVDNNETGQTSNSVILKNLFSL